MVSKHSSRNSQGVRCVKDGLGTDTGILINNPGSHGFLSKLYQQPKQESPHSSGKAHPLIPRISTF